MTEDEYRRDAAARGYDAPVQKAWRAGRFNDWHVHPFCLYVYVQSGEMTLQLEGPDGPETVVCGPGEAVEVPVNMRHTERIGAAGTRFLSAPRHPA
jgi:quercetin dioxygenase-like cupin family protein